MLSVCIGVGGCGCPNSEKMRRMTLAFLAFINNEPSSALAAEATTVSKCTCDGDFTVELEWCAVVRHAT